MAVESGNGMTRLMRGRGGLLLLAVLVILIAGASIGAAVWRADLPVRAAVTEGNRIIGRDAILRMAAVPMDRRLMDIDLGAIRTRVLKNPYFRDASVNRDLPDRIVIHVDERVPVAMLIADRTLYVDAEGMILTGIRSDAVFDLPVITGAAAVQDCRPGKRVTHPALKEALQIVLAAERLGSSVSRRISEIHLRQNGDLLLYTSEFGIPVAFGRGDIVDKLTLLESFWTGVVSSRGGQALQAVDLRFTDHVIARWETPATN